MMVTCYSLVLYFLYRAIVFSFFFFLSFLGGRGRKVVKEQEVCFNGRFFVRDDKSRLDVFNVSKVVWRENGTRKSRR